MIIDNIDGVIARFIYGQDPPQRGSLDLIIDSFAASIILLTIFFVMMKTAIYFCAFLVFLYVIFLFLLYVQTSTVYRLRSEFSERLKDIVVNKEDEGHYKFLPSFLVNAYFKIDKFTAKHRTLVHPTACDSAFIIYVILPLLNFNFYTPLLIIAILFIILDIFQELVIILSYFRNL
ncbi:MAG: hypothetical protein PHO28_04295 [Candidatus Pacebacteria bacterium]|nr:hypothetical protein [Candidatus Paceibacterota bacterium]